MRWLLAAVVLIHLAQSQKIVTKGKTITVNEGEQLELPCYVQDLGSESIIWRRKENPLFIDEENLAEDERMQVIKDGSNSTLTILDVEPMDMSDYVCAVSEPEQEIVYRIIVHSVFDKDQPVCNSHGHNASSAIAAANAQAGADKKRLLDVMLLTSPRRRVQLFS
ncbi:unnamed protein product [Heligmosomoides polygyrus]|uniref:Ig-like domain-containing protein n=1 Tax=Heligmosomoides polygyrus TaxID=6339 RepID=A0A183G0Q5_HELPZ|nr:unnamed protein product [Heligmosomoides polygyrus]